MDIVSLAKYNTLRRKSDPWTGQQLRRGAAGGKIPGAFQDINGNWSVDLDEHDRIVIAQILGNSASNDDDVVASILEIMS